MLNRKKIKMFCVATRDLLFCVEAMMKTRELLVQSHSVAGAALMLLGQPSFSLLN